MEKMMEITTLGYIGDLKGVYIHTYIYMYTYITL